MACQVQLHSSFPSHVYDRVDNEGGATAAVQELKKIHVSQYTDMAATQNSFTRGLGRHNTSCSFDAANSF